MHHFILGSLGALLFQLHSTKIYHIPFGYQPCTETRKLCPSFLDSISLRKSHGIVWGFIFPVYEPVKGSWEALCTLFSQYLFSVIRRTIVVKLNVLQECTFLTFHSYLWMVGGRFYCCGVWSTLYIPPFIKILTIGRTYLLKFAFVFFFFVVVFVCFETKFRLKS